MSLWGEVVSDANPDTPDAPDNNAPEGGQAK
jgi:hypothetical protein